MSFLTQIPWNSLKAAGRYTLATAGGGIAVAAAVGLMSQSDAATAGQALKDAATALGNLATALVTLAGIAASVYAGIKGSFAATPKAQMAAIAEQGSVVITDPQTAKSIPSPNVVSSIQEAAKLPGVEPTIASANAAQAVRAAIVATK